MKQRGFAVVIATIAFAFYLFSGSQYDVEDTLNIMYGWRKVPHFHTLPREHKCSYVNREITACHHLEDHIVREYMICKNPDKYMVRDYEENDYPGEIATAYERIRVENIKILEEKNGGILRLILLFTFVILTISLAYITS